MGCANAALANVSFVCDESPKIALQDEPLGPISHGIHGMADSARRRSHCSQFRTCFHADLYGDGLPIFANSLALSAVFCDRVGIIRVDRN